MSALRARDPFRPAVALRVALGQQRRRRGHGWQDLLDFVNPAEWEAVTGEQTPQFRQDRERVHFRGLIRSLDDGNPDIVDNAVIYEWDVDAPSWSRVYVVPEHTTDSYDLAAASWGLFMGSVGLPSYTAHGGSLFIQQTGYGLEYDDAGLNNGFPAAGTTFTLEGASFDIPLRYEFGEVYHGGGEIFGNLSDT